MSGHVCEVHSEYVRDGEACRWCEARTAVHPNVPKGSTLCRCGEYAWAPWARPEERNGVIAGVAHSPEQCFKLDADPPGADALRVTGYFEPSGLNEQWGEWPGTRASPDVMAAMEDGIRRIIRARFRDDCIEAAYFMFDDADADRLLTEQHASLRWERVARRWNWKHRPSWLPGLAIVSAGKLREGVLR